MAQAPDSVTEQLRTLLRGPDAVMSQQHAQQVVAAALPTPLIASRLNSVLQPLLKAEQAKAAQLSAQLAQSTEETTALLDSTKQQLAALLQRTSELRSNHESMEDALIDHTEVLVSSASQREPGEDGKADGQGATLRERLETFSQRRKELEIAKQWFSVLAKAEELGYVPLRYVIQFRLTSRRISIASLRALEAGDLPSALQGYVALVDYIKEIHARAPALALTSHLVAMASSVWRGLVKLLSA